MDYIHWNPSLEIFSIWGVTIRWYGLLWVVGLLGNSIIVNKINKYQKEKLLVEQLFYFCFVGVLAGARIGHCIFYDASEWLGAELFPTASQVHPEHIPNASRRTKDIKNLHFHVR